MYTIDCVVVIYYVNKTVDNTVVVHSTVHTCVTTHICMNTRTVQAQVLHVPYYTCITIMVYAYATMATI